MRHLPVELETILIVVLPVELETILIICLTQSRFQRKISSGHLMNKNFEPLIQLEMTTFAAKLTQFVDDG